MFVRPALVKMEKELLQFQEITAPKSGNFSGGISLTTLNNHKGEVESGVYNADETKIITGAGRTTVTVWDAESASMLYSFFTVGEDGYLIIDKDGHFDGTDDAVKMLYFTCGTEVIKLDQLIDKLWVPNLARRLMNGEKINEPSLDQLDICSLTPDVEIVNDKGGYLHYEITPRRGKLGETVLSINNIEVKRYNITELLKKNNKYELIISRKKLEQFFTPGQENPVEVKAYIASNDISSRGVIINTKEKNNDTIPPKLYAVMVGVSDYKGNELDLKYASTDAHDLSIALGAAARKLLNTTKDDNVFIYNLTTTNDHLFPDKATIRKTLEEISRKALAKDILLIFFAGHGTKEGEKNQFYFLTADASRASLGGNIADVGISTNELTEWIKPQNIKDKENINI